MKKRKFLVIFLAIATALCMAFGLSACGEKEPEREQSDFWSMERVYASAQELGFQGTLEELIAMFKGEKGDTGAPGKDGADGEDGKDGAQGPQGKKGEKGDTGAQGPQGEKGEKGDTGAQGPQGEKGEKGDTGASGKDGADGANGKDGIGIRSMEVDENGHLIVTLTDGTEIDLGKITADAISEEGTEGLQYQKRRDEEGNDYAAVAGLGTAWDSDIVIPAEYRGLPVKEIGTSAFSANHDERNAHLTSISIPNSVTKIGSSAFAGCSGLTSIDIPDSVISIGDSAFAACSGLTSVDIPDSVISIGDSAFAGCSGLTSVDIPNSVISIGDSAFNGCSGLTSVTIGSGVTEIGYSAFRGCYRLVEVWDFSELQITVGSDKNGYIGIYAKQVYKTNASSKQTKTDDGYLFYEDGAASFLLEYIGASTELSLPTNSPHGKDYMINTYAFMEEGLTSVTIPDSVTEIGYGAFYGCSGLTSVTIGSGVTEIKDLAFANCGAIEKFTVEKANRNYSSQSGILYQKGEIFYVPQKIKGAVAIPDSVTEIPDSTFRGCSAITSVTFGGNSKLTLIGNWAFLGCSGLTSIVIPRNVTKIGDSAFDGCGELSSVTFERESKLSLIGNWAFRGCKFTSIVIPRSVTIVAVGVFDGCEQLQYVYFENKSGWRSDAPGVYGPVSWTADAAAAASYLRSTPYNQGTLYHD